jgi:AcrR family transcriptional regulator
MARVKTIDDDVILAAAREILLSDGLGASTKSIAIRAGVSEGVLFQRFGTKNNLVLSALTTACISIPEFANGVRGLSPKARIHTVADAVMTYYRAALPCELLLLTHPEFDVSAWRKTFHGSPSEHLAMNLIVYIEQEIENSRLPIADPMAVGIALMSCLHSAVLFELQGAHGGKIEDEFIFRIVDAICRDFPD